jgi:hypothetical protein
MGLIDVKGRYPGTFAPKLDSRQIDASSLVMPHEVRLRVDDLDNDDFWMELRIPAHVVHSWQRQILEQRGVFGASEQKEAGEGV